MCKDINKIVEDIQKHKALFSLPKVVDKGEDVLPFLLSTMNDYTNFVNSTDWIEDKHRAMKITKLIKESLQFYYQGNIIESLLKMAFILEDQEKLGELLLVNKITDFLPTQEKNNLYKARIGNYEGFSRQEMFHIPFNERSNTNNQRFSISGIPCLYLGCSVYSCWEELNRPDFNSFWISRYQLDDNDFPFLFLNLSLNLYDVSKLPESDIEDKIDWIHKYIFTWILQFCCSIKVKEDGRSFKEEYIIPQLLMQVIRGKKIAGIIYNSVKIDNCVNQYWIMRNIAIPADDFSFNDSDITKDDIYNKLYSEKLKQSFKVTDPINMGMINSVLSRQGEVEIAVNYHPRTINYFRTNSSINLGNSISVPYQFTKFYDVENILNKIPTYDL